MDVLVTLLMLAGPATPPAVPALAAACKLEASQPARPRGSPASWITAIDYPPWESLTATEGLVWFRLLVGRDGRPTACNVTLSSGDARLDAHTCRIIMRRARFCPATNHRAIPIEGEWNGSLRWMMPDDPPAPPEAG